MTTVGGIKWRLAHQPVHAGLGAQEAIGIVTFDLDGGRLDAGNLAVGLLQDFGLEALAFAIAQVLAQKHRGPVLCLGTAGTSLDVDEAVVGIHRVAEHAAKLHPLDQLAQAIGVGFDGDHGVFILLVACHGKQVAGVAQLGVHLRQCHDDRFERFLFLAEILGPLLVIPDGRVLQFGIYLFELF